MIFWQTLSRLNTWSSTSYYYVSQQAWSEFTLWTVHYLYLGKEIVRIHTPLLNIMTFHPNRLWCGTGSDVITVGPMEADTQIIQSGTTHGPYMWSQYRYPEVRIVVMATMWRKHSRVIISYYSSYRCIRFFDAPHCLTSLVSPWFPRLTFDFLLSPGRPYWFTHVCPSLILVSQQLLDIFLPNLHNRYYIWISESD